MVIFQSGCMFLVKFFISSFKMIVCTSQFVGYRKIANIYQGIRIRIRTWDKDVVAETNLGIRIHLPLQWGRQQGGSNGAITREILSHVTQDTMSTWEIAVTQAQTSPNIQISVPVKCDVTHVTYDVTICDSQTMSRLFPAGIEKWLWSCPLYLLEFERVIIMAIFMRFHG